jgi:hypothetical protein
MLKMKRNGPGSYYYWDAELGVEFHISREEQFADNDRTRLAYMWVIRFSHNAEIASEWSFHTKAQALIDLQSIIREISTDDYVRPNTQREFALSVESNAYTFRDSSPQFLANLDDMYHKSEWWRQVRAAM